jgi:hypothetical protein
MLSFGAKLSNGCEAGSDGERTKEKALRDAAALQALSQEGKKTFAFCEGQLGVRRRPFCPSASGTFGGQGVSPAPAMRDFGAHVRGNRRVTRSSKAALGSPCCAAVLSFRLACRGGSTLLRRGRFARETHQATRAKVQASTCRRRCHRCPAPSASASTSGKVPVVAKTVAHERPRLLIRLEIFGARLAASRFVATENVQRVHRFELDPPLAKIA